MLPPQSLLQAAAALASACFGALILLQRPRKTEWRIMGIFLALIAANQAIEAIRHLVADPEQMVRLHRLASIPAALDPVCLWYWMSRISGRSRWLEGTIIAAAGSTLAIWAGWGPLVLPGTPTFTSAVLALRAFEGMLALFTSAVYTRVLFLALDESVLRPNDFWRQVILALGIAVIPTVVRLGAFTSEAFWFVGFPIMGGIALNVVLTVTLIGGLLLRARTLASRETIRSAVVAGLAMLVLIHAPGPVEREFGIESPGLFTFLGHAGSAIRWLAFGALISTAIFRDNALGLTMSARRTGARVLVTLALICVILSATVALQAALGSQDPAVQVGFSAAMLLAVVLSQGFAKLVDQAASAIYDVPKTTDLARVSALYREAVVETILRGEAPTRNARLQRLREELGIDAPTAQTIEALAERSIDGPLTPHQILAGRYVAECLIGRGGGGQVFLGQDTMLHRPVALKEIVKDEMEHGIAEARALVAVQHPHIVILHDVVERAGSIVLVTEFLPGGSLADLLETQGPRPPEEMLPRLLEILEGLAAIHARGLVHGDLKPSNVLLDARGVAKVADFGLARSRDRTVDAQDLQARGGTPAYMAPELHDGGRPTPTSDMYAWGLIARRAVQPPLPLEWERLINKALRKSPPQRWPDAGSALRSVARFSKRRPAATTRRDADGRIDR